MSCHADAKKHKKRPTDRSLRDLQNALGGSRRARKALGGSRPTPDVGSRAVLGGGQRITGTRRSSEALDGSRPTRESDRKPSSAGVNESRARADPPDEAGRGASRALRAARVAAVRALARCVARDDQVVA